MFAAVSYTHLDVYKRQVVNSAGEVSRQRGDFLRYQRLGGIVGGELDGGIEAVGLGIRTLERPVSYTHLSPIIQPIIAPFHLDVHDDQ